MDDKEYEKTFMHLASPPPFEILEEVAELIIHNAVEIIGRVGYCKHGPEADSFLSIYPIADEQTSGPYDGEELYPLPHYDLNAIAELFPGMRWGSWSIFHDEISLEIPYKGYHLMVLLRGSPFPDYDEG
jgi:hypothetical protein